MHGPFFSSDMLYSMRRLVLESVLLTATFAAAPITAQTLSETDVVSRLTSDLLPLKLAVASDEPLKDHVYSLAELQSLETYSQSQAMKPFRTTWPSSNFNT